MAWNEPERPNDPWASSSGRRNSGNNDVLKRIFEPFRSLFGKGGKRSPGSTLAVILIFLLLGLSILYRSVYFVNEQERGIVLQLGKYDRTLTPGLRFILPFFEHVEKVVNVTNVKNSELSTLMLTKDENVVKVEMNIQYRAADPFSFALKVRDPVGTLEQAAESALRHEVGGSMLDAVLTSGRPKLAAGVEQRLQGYLDLYETGIEVVNVNVKEVRAPSAVQAAFDDVQKAKLDKERYINESEAYSNTVIPKARGESRVMFEQAAAYKARIVARAEGEAQRFEKLLVEYKRAPEVTRRRLYLETITEVMQSVTKVVVEDKSGNNLLYLPLDKIVAAAEQQPVLNQSNRSEIVRDVLEQLNKQHQRDQHQRPRGRRRTQNRLLEGE